MKFEQKLKELEKMNEQMASGRLSLTESMETFKKGVQLIEECKKEISQAEQSAQKLLNINKETGEIETEDFKADN